jgi:hypothetical protein
MGAFLQDANVLAPYAGTCFIPVHPFFFLLFTYFHSKLAPISVYTLFFVLLNTIMIVVYSSILV